MLSGIEPMELIRAVRDQNVARLTKIPGVGKKTAERIGLELKDRLPVAPLALQPGRPPASPQEQLRADVLSALANLGYQPSPAEKALDGVLKNGGDDVQFEQALRAALKALMRA